MNSTHCRLLHDRESFTPGGCAPDSRGRAEQARRWEARVRSVNSLFRQFVFLNILDGLTTYAGIVLNKGHEFNLLPALAFYFAPDPLAVIIAMKAFAIAVGITLCFGENRWWLSRVNIIFSAIVIWNCIILSF